MKIALLNPTFWPVAGGPESCMKQQAELLAESGHEVRVLAGMGEPSAETYLVDNLASLHPEDEMNLRVKRAVDHGQTDATFQEFTGRIKNDLTPFFQWADIVVDHGALTTHHNLALTRAVWELGEAFPLLTWAHDFTAANKSYALPCPEHHPWSLMRTAHPRAIYVAVSQRRRDELRKILQLPEDRLPLIEPTVDLNDCLGLDPWFFKRLAPWNVTSRDLVLYYPSKVLQRKNIDLAFQIAAALRMDGIDAFLAVSGAPDPFQSGKSQYQSYVESLPKHLGLEEHSCFLTQVFQDPLVAWQQMFRLSDAILFTSGYEGYGVPVVEALLHRLPCWCAMDPQLSGWPDAHIRKVATPQDALREAKSLLADPVHQARHERLRRQIPKCFHDEVLLPLFERAAKS